MKARVKATGEIVNVTHIGTKYYLYDLNNVEILDELDYWEKLHHQAAIAAMPIADSIVDKLDSSKHHREDGCYGMHSIDLFVDECVGIATALVNRLKEESQCEK